MAEMSDYLENAIIDHVFRNTALTSPTTVYLALYSVSPSDSGGGTEVSGGSYARQAITFGAPSNGVATNTNTLTFLNMPGVTVVAGAIFDASTGGNMLMWTPATASIAVTATDNYIVAVGEVQVTMT